VFLSLGTCPACDAPAAAERSELNATYVASFSQLAVDPGQYLVCLCASQDSTAGKAVASLTVDGIQ
ncbi:HERC2, partial [Symbiodinium sp. CCMP2456]